MKPVLALNLLVPSFSYLPCIAYGLHGIGIYWVFSELVN